MNRGVTIIGSGSWATALVKLFSDNGTKVIWLVRNQQIAEFVAKHGYNPRYLSFAALQKELITPVVDPSLAVRNVDMVIFAVPSAHLISTLQAFDKELFDGKNIAVSIKGFVPATGCTPSRYIGNFFARQAGSVMVLGGPCHAEEIANQKTTYVTLSAGDLGWAQQISQRLKSHYVRTVINDDPAGVEYASILKNIIGIATGIAHGLQYGDNFNAVLVSNAMRETNDFLQVIEDRQRDIFQSAYLGDLLVTAYSDHSRNRMLGKLIGRGIHVNKALHAMEMTAEGFYASAELAMPLKRYKKLNLPIIQSVYRILHRHSNPYHEFKLLEEQLS